MNPPSDHHPFQIPTVGSRKLFGSGLRLGGVPGLPSIEDFPTEPLQHPAGQFPNRDEEARRVVKRLQAIVADHVQSAVRMGVETTHLDFKLVIGWLREHAQGGQPMLKTSGDPIIDYLHQGLIDDLLLEPANILLATPTGPDSIRYDAMDAKFWGECLDLFETLTSRNS